MKKIGLFLVFLLVSQAAFSEQGDIPIDPGHFSRPQVTSYISRFTRGADRQWLEYSLDRAILYLSHIENSVLEMQLPEELTYLPVVESGFNPAATSPRGAAGLWQLMASSVENQDITMDDWLDERRDFWKSTKVSLEKLAYNYRVLGDWLLALAAYNCGLARTQRAIAESGKNDFWTISAAGFLPKETTLYVPKFLAVSYICLNPDRYDLQLNRESYTTWQRIALDGSVSIEALAIEAKVPISLIRFGNAELRYGVSPPVSGSYLLKVPDKYSDVIKRALQNGSLVHAECYVHEVRTGDTLSALAKRFGVSVRMIMQLNPSLKPRFLLIGKPVLIPAFGTVEPYPENNNEADGIPAAQARYYRVQEGDTLWDIAKKYATSIDTIAKANRIADQNIILPGSMLKIPGKHYKFWIN